MANTQISNGTVGNGTSIAHQLESDSARSETSTSYAEKMKSVANEASHQVSRIANDASQQAAGAYDNATSAVGRRLADTGSRLEDSDIVQRTGRRMNEVGNYLDQAKLDDLSTYARTTVRRHPLAAVAIGVGAGMLLGRWISK